MSAVRPRLLFTPDHGRFFLIPADVRLPPGELVLHTLQGTSDRVDEAAAAAHEVDREAARAHVDAGWERALGGVRDSLRELLGRPPAETPPVLPRWLGGATPGEVLVDPERRREARRNLLREASGLVGGWDEGRLDAAEARLDRLGEQARAGAGEVRAAADELTEGLQERAPALERTLAEVAKGLTELGHRLFDGVRPPAEPPSEAPPTPGGPPSDEEPR